MRSRSTMSCKIGEFTSRIRIWRIWFMSFYWAFIEAAALLRFKNELRQDISSSHTCHTSLHRADTTLPYYTFRCNTWSQVQQPEPGSPCSESYRQTWLLAEGRPLTPVTFMGL
jgi:hypothetical protein